MPNPQKQRPRQPQNAIDHLIVTLARPYEAAEGKTLSHTARTNRLSRALEQFGYVGEHKITAQNIRTAATRGSMSKRTMTAFGALAEKQGLTLSSDDIAMLMGVTPPLKDNPFETRSS